MISTVAEIEHLLTAAILAANGTPPPEYKFEVPVRCGAPDKGPRNRSAIAIVKSDVGIYYSHVEGETIATVFPGTDVDQSRSRRPAQDIAAERLRAEAETAELNRIGTARWAAAWEAATPSEQLPTPPYLLLKGETLPRCRIAGDGRVMIPRYAIDGEMVGGQWIGATPDVHGKFQKRYSMGTPTRGTFFLLGTIEPDGKVIVCEGAVTGATLHRETGRAVACAMDCGNLLAVCEALRDRYPDIAITVAGDDDRTTADNPGRTKAMQAATIIGGLVWFPEFCEVCDGTCSDFNDVATCRPSVR